MTKRVIAILTRGYRNKRRYGMLIRRNKSIEKYLSNKDIDCVIFHEGNINLYHQKYIKRQTPSLQIKFIDVGNEFNPGRQCKVYDPTKIFGLSYRHMCSFWFIGFWKYLNDYDQVLRIDEDCIIYFDIMKCFEMLQNKVSVYGMYSVDRDYVTKGLNDFTKEFFLTETGENIPQKVSGGPYTNIIVFDLKKLRENLLLKKYIHAIDKSNNIYIYRWGDLPLWGEVLNYFYKENEHICSKSIKYYHGSHNIKVNM